MAQTFEQFIEYLGNYDNLYEAAAKGGTQEVKALVRIFAEKAWSEGRESQIEIRARAIAERTGK